MSPSEDPKPELIVVPPSNDGEGEAATEAVQEPAKVMRIGTMVKQLLEEVREADLDEKGRARLRDIHERSIAELTDGLSPDLQAELARLALPFDGEETPSESELRIAHAQLVGWLEGLFHGVQAALMMQQASAQAQLAQMRQRGLPAGPTAGDEADEDSGRPGTYL